MRVGVFPQLFIGLIKKMSNLKKVFKQIVQIDSQSGEEKKMISFINNYFNNRGIKKYYSDKEGNTLFRLGKIGKPILISAHLDTVIPGKNIVPILKKGLWQSNGKTILGADNKSSVAVILSVIDEIIKKKDIPNLEILFTVKEEIGDNLLTFPFTILESKKGVIFDSANPIGGIVLSSPEITNFKIEFIGKVAHSSRPDLGINSILALKYFLAKIKLGFNDKKQTIINIGQISGGEGVNTIPGNICLKGEIRSFKKKLFNQKIELIKRILKNIKLKFKIRVKIYFSGYLPGYNHKKNNKWVIFLAKSINKELGSQSKYFQTSGVSDANFFNFKNIKVVNLTDGVVEAHTKKEKIKQKDMDTLSKILKNIIFNFRA